MRTLKIYEAGKMSGLSFEEMNIWREKLKSLLFSAAEIANYQIQVINPVNFYNFEEKVYQSESEVEEYDLAHVISSDIIVVNLDGLSSSDGTKIELHDAKYHNRIPVIAFGERKLYEELHPWIKVNIIRVENTMEDVVKYIQDFYMIWVEVRKLKIKLNTITDVNCFVNSSVKYYEGNIDVKQGRQIVDGKSVLGIFSLNLMEPLEVSIETDNKDTERNFYNFISKWRVDKEGENRTSKKDN